MQASIITEIDRAVKIHNKLVRKLEEEQKRSFFWKMEMSWIYHDSALDGIVLSGADINDAFNVQVVSDISLQPLYTEVRNHKEAVDYIRTVVSKKTFTINQEILRRLQNIFSSQGINSRKPIKYRREIPIHRMYFHEIISTKNMKKTMEQFFKWANSKESKRMHVIARASHIHYRFMRIFPFATHSGKIGRMLMNILIMRGGYLPVIIHASDRQNYYETLRESPDALQDLVERSLLNTIKSNIRVLEDLIPGSSRYLNGLSSF